MSKSTSNTPATEGSILTIESAAVAVKLMHDGQEMTFPIPAEIAANDQLLLDFLVSSGMTGAANGLVKRHENGSVEVIKRAGSNGKGEGGEIDKAVTEGVEDWPEPTAEDDCPPPVGVVGLMLAELQAASPHFNPAIALAWLLSRVEHQGGLDLMSLMLAQGPIQTAIQMGEAESKQGKDILSQLQNARALPCSGPSVLI